MERIIHILVLCVVSRLYSVSGQYCTGKPPVIDPPVLVVKYGGPAAASCISDYSAEMMGWEAPMGNKNGENTQQLVWSVNSTAWLLRNGITCYTSSGEHGQCETYLPITIYKTPANVTFLSTHTGPLLEGHQYQLQCEVQSVAPVHNLTIIWFRGDTELEQSHFPQFTIKGDQSKDVTVTANLSITASRDDHGVPYSCAARLDLNTAESIPDTKSNAVQLEVYYKPKVLNTTGNVIIEEGQELRLSCKADANPSPMYEWTHNGVALGRKDTLIIRSVTVDNKGVYKCLIKNNQGQVSAEMDVSVEVKGSHTGIIVGVVVVLIVLIAVLAGLWKKFKKKL